MSQFNPKNLQQVLALSLMVAEVQAFDTISTKSQLNAEKLGLAPTDIEQLHATLNNIEALNKLANDPGFSSDPNFQEALKLGAEVAVTYGIAIETVLVAKEKQLVTLNDEGELVWDDVLHDAEVRADLRNEVKRRIIANINGATKNEDNEEVEQQDAREGRSEAGDAVGQEQEEGRDEGRDVSVSAPLAA